MKAKLKNYTLNYITKIIMYSTKCQTNNNHIYYTNQILFFLFQ